MAESRQPLKRAGQKRANKLRFSAVLVRVHSIHSKGARRNGYSWFKTFPPVRPEAGPLARPDPSPTLFRVVGFGGQTLGRGVRKQLQGRLRGHPGAGPL